MDAPIENLLRGHERFQKKFFGENNALYKTLVQLGQQPKVMVIACSDSRVDPSALFDAQPGDLFVVRNVANLVPPCETGDAYHGTSAALEFGVCFLQVQHIIVLSHSECGGIKTLAQESTQVHASGSGYIAKWMEIARAHHALSRATQSPTLQTIALDALENSITNLMSFSWIAERVHQGSLQLHAWYFDLQSGKLHIHNAHKPLGTCNQHNQF